MCLWATVNQNYFSVFNKLLTVVGHFWNEDCEIILHNLRFNMVLNLESYVFEIWNLRIDKVDHVLNISWKRLSYLIITCFDKFIIVTISLSFRTSSSRKKSRRLINGWSISKIFGPFGNLIILFLLGLLMIRSYFLYGLWRLRVLLDKEDFRSYHFPLNNYSTFLFNMSTREEFFDLLKDEILNLVITI